MIGAAIWWFYRPKAIEVQTTPVRAITAAAGEGARTLLNASGYVTARRAATVSSKVTGRVIDVKVLQGLGHGLDEAALSAARGASFTPAQRCGRPVRATFTIAMRFSAS